MKNHNYAVIMAGGVGSRFWPVSTAENPKQFQDILGCGQTLIQATFTRLQKVVPKEHIFILTNKIYEATVLEQLPVVTPANIVCEPAMRNTAPCILLAALKIWKKDAEAKMLVAPSDHWIPQEDKFIHDIELAFNEIEQSDDLVTFGIPPTSPNTGYGYIQYDDSAHSNIFHVKRFTEKPNLENAKRFLQEGDYLWNSGIFAWRTDTILQSFQQFLPEMYQLFLNGFSFLNTCEEFSFLEENFSKAQNISIDFGIIEKASTVKVIPASFSWNDLGTWCSIQGELPQDAASNTVVNSRFIPEQASGNIIRTQAGKVVYIDGLKDYMILEEDNVLVIVPKQKEQEIKVIRQTVLEKFGASFG